MLLVGFGWSVGLPHNKFYPNRKKNAEVQICKICKRFQKFPDPRAFCTFSLDQELWKIFLLLVSPKVLSCLENSLTFPNIFKKKIKNLSEDQKVELVIWLSSNDDIVAELYDKFRSFSSYYNSNFHLQNFHFFFQCVIQFVNYF